jgi:RsiW-degrading membrane proteinase PrsW (M82 family)
VTRLFLWGVAGGAGFAAVEGMLNASMSTDAWLMVALLRVGSSAMHCLTAGLTGWGWGQVWTRRKWLYLLLAYTLAVVVHGVWNALSGGMAVLEGVLDPGALQNTLLVMAIALLALLTVGMIAALMALAKKLRVGGGT